MKPNHSSKIVTALALALLVAIILFLNRPAPIEAQGAKKVQYKAVELYFYTTDTERTIREQTSALNAQAAQGWRLVEIKTFTQYNSTVIAYFVKGQ
jgi:hypothetical protein